MSTMPHPYQGETEGLVSTLRAQPLGRSLRALLLLTHPSRELIALILLGSALPRFTTVQCFTKADFVFVF